MELANPFETLAAMDYNASEEQITEIARLAAAGDAVTGKAGGAYLRALVKLTQLDIGSGAVSMEHLRLAFERVNAACYGAVLRGVVTADCESVRGVDRTESRRRSLERNRRSNFARTAASAVRGFIAGGGDIAKVAASDVTKQSLVEATRLLNSVEVSAPADAAPVAATSRRMVTDADRAVDRSYKRLMRSLRSVQDTDRRAFLATAVRDSIVANFIPTEA